MQNVAIPACFSQTVQRELELNPQLRNMPESAPGFSLLIHGPCVLWELPAGSWKAAGTKCGWGMWIVPVVPVPQWDISPLNLSEKVMIPQQFHKNFWNLFLLKPPLCPALLCAVNNCTSRMISPILGVEMLFLQLSRCAPNDIQFLFWAWKRRQEINSGLLEQENSAGKENCSLVGQGEAKAVRREGFESWHSSACCSLTALPVSAQLSVDRFGCRRCPRLGLPSLFLPALSLQWDGLAPRLQSVADCHRGHRCP